MNWEVGQKLVCDRPEQLLTGCFIADKTSEGLTVSCPAIGIVISQQQQQLERLGWKLDEQRELHNVTQLEVPRSLNSNCSQETRLKASVLKLPGGIFTVG
jgi:hypothetical protein